ncbi:MAG: hypothetical protein Q4B96_00690 [Bacillota bacterium]|nr:hypothetical protein [Bacillota bacterium]
MSQQMQQVRLLHPLNGSHIDMELPTDITFNQISRLLYERGFIQKKAGGYQYIIDERLCGLNYPLATYIPDPAPELLTISVNGLLVVLT